MKKTYTLGRETPLEDTIEKMQGLLQFHGFNIIDKNWLNPVPRVWSVHIRDTDCDLLSANGKGDSPKAALASALGEFFERLSTNFFFADYWLGEKISTEEFVHFPDEKWFQDISPPKGCENKNSKNTLSLLDAHLRHIYDPDQTMTADMLVDLFSGRQERGICALPFKRVKDNKTILFPVNILDNLYASNGMAAGNTLNEAVVQALSEIIERSIKNRIISRGIGLPDIPPAVIDQYPHISQGIKILEKGNYKLFLKDASLGGKFPVVNITLVNRETSGCYAAFGAHPDFETALLRCFTELLQGRTTDQLDTFPLPSFDLDITGDPENLETHFVDSSGIIPWQMLKDDPDYSFFSWGCKGSTEQMKEQLLTLMDQEGYQVYMASYKHLGIDVCRILVPGFSEIYPVDELYWNNNSQAVFLHPFIFSLKDLDRKELDTFFQMLFQEELSDIKPLALQLGIPEEENSIWEDLYLPEIKACLCLALGHPDRAAQEIKTLLFSGYVHKNKQRHYQCLSAILQLHLKGVDSDGYKRILVTCFGEKTVSRCQDMAKGKSIFNGLQDLNRFEALTSRQAVFKAYLKTQKAKQHWYEHRKRT